MVKRLGAVCGSCGAQVQAVSAFCHRCGYGLSPLEATGAAHTGPAWAPAPRSGGVDLRDPAPRSGRVVLEDLMAELTARESVVPAAASGAAPATAGTTAAPSTAEITAETTAEPTVEWIPDPVPSGLVPSGPVPSGLVPSDPVPAIDPQETVFGLVGEPVPDDGAAVRAPVRRRALVLVAAGVVVVLALAAVAVLVLRPAGPRAGAAVRARPATAAAGSSWSSSASAQAPATSPDSRDAAGRATSYAAAQVLDGDPATAWRMNGDGARSVLTLTLDAAHPVRTVGLVNGYAKVDPASGADRYTQERRITHVTWIIDGREHPQALRDGDRSVQRLTVPPVSTRQVQLRIDATTAPGDRSFDRTAISDVLLAG